MLNRYDVGSSRPRREVELGQLVYIQDGIRPFGVSRDWSPVLREPWQVIGWKNREYFPCVPGRPSVTYLRGGHLAVVRSLRTGRVCEVADWYILASLKLTDHYQRDHSRPLRAVPFADIEVVA